MNGWICIMHALYTCNATQAKNGCNKYPALTLIPYDNQGWVLPICLLNCSASQWATGPIAHLACFETTHTRLGWVLSLWHGHTFCAILLHSRGWNDNNWQHPFMYLHSYCHMKLTLFDRQSLHHQHLWFIGLQHTVGLYEVIVLFKPVLYREILIPFLKTVGKASVPLVPKKPKAHMSTSSLFTDDTKNKACQLEYCSSCYHHVTSYGSHVGLTPVLTTGWVNKIIFPNR